jgi:hypothetical protein
MSTLIAVRIPDDLIAAIDAQGKRSSVIIAILQNHFDKSRPEWAKPPIPKHDILDAAIERAPEGAIAVELRGGDNADILIERREISTRSHNPKTCTLYGCLMCKMVKEG